MLLFQRVIAFGGEDALPIAKDADCQRANFGFGHRHSLENTLLNRKDKQLNRKGAKYAKKENN
jgi:hypothetical protein